ncbi:MAG: hypothetical protein HY303_05085 [Candidatus Wallbacteria bacterium]|nr:hypothetical protein [Candidatus Wallbacteria bacterium]
MTIGLGSLSDSVLALFQNGGTSPFAENDDTPGLGFASRIGYSASTTEPVFVLVRHRSTDGTGTYNVRVSDSPIDFQAVSLTADRTIVSAGGSLPVTFTIRYADPHDVDAPVFAVFAQVTLETDAGTVQAYGYNAGVSLVAGQTQQLETRLAIPLSVAAGSYVLRARLDPASYGTPDIDSGNDSIQLASRIMVRTAIDAQARSVELPNGTFSQGDAIPTTVNLGYLAGASDLEPQNLPVTLFFSTDRVFDAASDIQAPAGAARGQRPVAAASALGDGDGEHDQPGGTRPWRRPATGTGHVAAGLFADASDLDRKGRGAHR